MQTLLSQDDPGKGRCGFTDRGLLLPEARYRKGRSVSAPGWILIAALLAALIGSFPAYGQDRNVSSSPAPSAQAGSSQPAASGELRYSLSPEMLRRAHHLYLWETALGFAGPIWGILLLIGILELHWAARLRDFVLRGTRHKWARELGFFVLLLLLMSLLELPLEILGHHVALSFGQSVERWPAWFADWGKSLALSVVFGTIALVVVFALIRASSRRWWFWAWLISLPAQVLVIFVLPLWISPLFYRFEPLQASHPQLVRQLERVIARTNVRIPPSRIFLMHASAKVTGANAYVTGFGPSKRVVVWDTTIKTCPENEILVIFGHELGHYVLHHIQRGMVYAAVISFFLMWAGYFLVLLLVGRYGGRWRLPSVRDCASAAVLLLVLAVLSFLAEPIANGISRAQEHQADVFGEEVVHGIVPHPGRVMAQAFQRLGEQSLEYPTPNGFVVFWTYTHPPIARREAFAAHYDPWEEGHKPRYFK